MKRLFDLFLCLIAAIFLVVPIWVVGMLVRLTSAGPVLYWSDRFDKNNQIF